MRRGWINRSRCRHSAGHLALANTGNQRLATEGLSTPTDFIASPLHCVVRPALRVIDAHRDDFGERHSPQNQKQQTDHMGHPRPAKRD